MSKYICCAPDIVIYMVFSLAMYQYCVRLRPLRSRHNPPKLDISVWAAIRHAISCERNTNSVVALRMLEHNHSAKFSASLQHHSVANTALGECSALHTALPVSRNALAKESREAGSHTVTHFPGCHCIAG